MTSREPILANLAFHDYQPPEADMARQALTTLRREQPGLHPKFLYDAEGSRLFEAITRQPEYYPTATERTLLEARAPELAKRVEPATLIAEPGAGNCEKARLLLEHWQPRGYMPIEISRDELLWASRELARDFPHLAIHAVCADYTRPVAWPDATPPPRMVFFPGSTLGNFEPAERVPFVHRLRELAGHGGSLLLGADLHKETAVLDAAYNDAAGYTAAFNRNVLHHLNRVLDAGFEPDAFEHEAFYNEQARRVEMHLRCHRDQTLQIDGETVHLPAGSTIHTENSYKFTRPELETLLEQAGFKVDTWWEDPDKAFSLCFANAIS